VDKLKDVVKPILSSELRTGRESFQCLTFRFLNKSFVSKVC
jgi:hypothetical protein